MLHLEDELKANLYEITLTYSEEVQQFFNKFDEIILKGSHDIGNCMMIEYTIRLTTDVLVVEKMGYHTPKEHK